jgi:transposase
MFLYEKQINKVFIHVDPVDFRKGINGLGAYVTNELGNSIQGKNLFVFGNRKRDKIKVMYWDDTGYAIWQKALEEDKFRWPSSSEAEMIVDAETLKFFLSGGEIIHQKIHKKIPPKSFF